MELQLLYLLLTIAVVAGDNDVTIQRGELNLNDTVQHSLTVDEGKLYNDICYEHYDNAVALARDLVGRGAATQLKNTFNLLIQHRRSRVVVFAYKLWEAGEKKIVENQFPAPFRMVFNDSLIKITSNKYGIPIEFSRFEDKDGDKNVYGREGNADSNNYIWKLEPVDNGKQVFFKIRHYSQSWYLKLGTSMDSDGEYQAYGSTDSDTERHQWMIQPDYYKEKVSFYILNRAHDQPLKLGTGVHEGNRNVYSTRGVYYNDPERYTWRIEAVTDPKTYEQ